MRAAVAPEPVQRSRTPHLQAVETAAVAAWGLAQGVVLHGSDRWGRCTAPDCANYFPDTTANRTEQFCSARCANRLTPSPP
ncbi:CGNR zinc finger domain-containing protein [Actinopolyspora alba]|uniref:CGNR zinc finger domain-containing protein n=1 Tax=Actinopolyspora alba TaxID=673379 RepID=UPI000B866C99